ncbi:hypothetical protein AB0M41_40455 [Streptomyces sp. NPDC051896]|uniref:hypothetical protein n=1 Tax=Streptomyces sp. NPDC051896 TaxID=3155416 RepID=UPI003427E66E
MKPIGHWRHRARGQGLRRPVGTRRPRRRSQADGLGRRPTHRRLDDPHRPHRLALTHDGRRRPAAVTERVQAFRDLSMTGISAAEYRTPVHVLQRMTHNAETAASPGTATAAPA